MPSQFLAWNADAMRAVPKFAVGVYVWVYNTVATTRQGAKTGTDAKVLKAKHSFNRTGPYEVLEVGLCTPTDTPDGSPLGAQLLYLDISSYISGADARRRVSVQRCNSYDHADMPKYLPVGLTQYALYNFSKNPPPYHVIQDDVWTPLRKLQMEKITGNQSVRGRGGVIAVLYETHWSGLSRPSRE